MRQIKISSYFGGGDRKRAFEESEAGSSKATAAASKKRKMGKAKTDKENGSRNLLTAFVRKPNKPVLSPKKNLTDNVRVSPDKTRASPKKLDFGEEPLLSDDVHLSPKKLEGEDQSPKKLLTDGIHFSPFSSEDLFEDVRVRPKKLFAEECLRISPEKLLSDDVHLRSKKFETKGPRVSPKKLLSDDAFVSPFSSEDLENVRVSPKKLLSGGLHLSPKKYETESRRVSPKNLLSDGIHLSPFSSEDLLSEKARVSPNKLLSDGLRLSPFGSKNVRVTPEKNRVSRELEFEFSDDGFEELIDSDSWQQKKSDLSFNRPVRCEVVRFAFASQPKYEQILELRASGSDKTGICKLRDMWTFTSFQVGETVSAKASDSTGEWVVDGKHGYVILRPDVMLPVTSLVRGMYCLRKGVLSNLHKNVKGNGRLMIMGRVLHDLLQEALRKELETEDDIAEALNALLNSQDYLREFYLNDMKMDDVTLEATTFVGKIANFIRSYVKGDAPVIGNNFRGRITEITDIEELVTSRNYGIQGRVDVTVKVESENRKRIMPLELKTGRASFSRDHKIQVMMYTLLLDELVRSVDSGLLLYLRDGILEEVKPESSEIRDFLMLRNEFVKYGRNELDFPEPIASKTCDRCSHARLCTVYLRHDGLNALSANHPIREVTFDDVTDSHVDYFVKWTKMINGECKSERLVIDDVALDAEPSPDGQDYRHVFRTAKTSSVQPGMTVEVGNPAQRGKILSVGDGVMEVLLGRPLKFGEFYRIESSKSSIQQIYLTNLAFLLEPEYRKLRELIIDRLPPSFEAGITKNLLNGDCLNVMKKLNREQQRAIFKVMAANDYVLIRGPPGTGKTETIVSLIKFLYLQNKSVLITGHTHSSIDNILLKLTGVDYVRFGSLSSVDDRLHDKCFVNLIRKCTDISEVAALYNRKVMASTCLGLDLEMIDKVRFDVCLIDESSQVMQAEAIRPLLFSRKFVLIGDSNQLPPVVKNPFAKSLGMDVSIFEFLERDSVVVSLSQQYRMNESLNGLANDLTYGGCLRCGSDVIARATLPGVAASETGWIRDALSPDMDKSAVFLDTSGLYEKSTPSRGDESRSNPVEAGIVCRLLTELKGNGIGDVGVVSPFCGQVRLVKKRLESLGIVGVEVNTVDQYQGRDKDVIIFSCAKRTTTTDAVDGHILSDHRRLTVAVTRAKVKLIIVGDAKCMSVYSPMKKLLSSLTQGQILRLKDGENDFSVCDLGLDSFDDL